MIRMQKIRSRPIAAMLVAAIVCAQSAIADEPEPGDDPYVVAKEHFDAQRWADAAASIRAALESAPDDPRAKPIRMYLAEALLNESKWAEAAVEYRKFLKDSDDASVDAYARFRLITALYAAEDYRGVIAEAPQLLEDYPLHDDAAQTRLFFGCAHSFLGNHAAAEAALAHVTAQYPDHPGVDYVLSIQAGCLAEIGRTSSAWTVISPHLSPEAANAKANRTVGGSILFRLGEEAYAAGRTADAEAYFDRLAVILPEAAAHSLVEFRRAELTVQRGNFTAAASRFKAAIDHGDLPAELLPAAWNGWIACRSQEQQWDEVLELATKAKHLFSEWSHAYEFDYLRGRALYAKAELNEARAAFAAVLASPNSGGTETEALARYMTAETYRLQQNYPAALAEFDKLAASPHPEWQKEGKTQAQRLREFLAQPNNTDRK